jgi:hypothetical protein
VWRYRALHRAVLAVVDLKALAGENHPVAVLQIGHPIGEGRQCDGIGTEVHAPLAVPDGQRRAASGPDHQVVLALEQDGEGERPLQPVERLRHGLAGRPPGLQRPVDQMRHHLGVGLGVERHPLADKLFLEFAKVLDDAVVHHRDPAGDMGMGVRLRRRPVGRPAGMADAGRAGEDMAGELIFELGELARGTHPLEAAAFENDDSGGVVAAVFEPGERVHQVRSGRPLAEDSDDATHLRLYLHFLSFCALCAATARWRAAHPSFTSWRPGQAPGHQAERRG